MKTDFLVYRMWIIETSSWEIVMGKKAERALEYSSEILENSWGTGKLVEGQGDHDQP